MPNTLCPPCQRGDCEECMSPDYLGAGRPSPYSCSLRHDTCARPTFDPSEIGAYDFGIPGGSDD